MLVLAITLSFSKEDEMYGIIADFLQHGVRRFTGCRTVVDKISFNLLKGWRIDVAGMIDRKNIHYIIAVEAKNEISPESILQAISQAEMYQKTCNEVYIALPNDGVNNFKRNTRNEWERIINLCKVKGIGIIGVGMQWQDCKIVNEAVRIPRYNDLYEDILNQLDFETLESFEGFDECDFDYFIGRADNREDVLKKKIQFLVEEIKHHMLSKPRNFPAIDPRELVVELPPRGFRRDGCWFFVAQVERKRLASVPHFTFHVDDEGVSCMLTLQSIKTTNTFVQKLRTKRDEFLAILKELHDIDEDYKLKIWEQIPEKGKPRRPQWSWHTICSFNVGYIDQNVVKLILNKLSNIKYSIIRVLCSPIKRGKSKLYTTEVVTRCTEWIKELQDMYSFLIT